MKCYGHADESVIALARRYYEKEHGGRVAVILTADGRALYQTNPAPKADAQPGAAGDAKAADENE